MDRRDTAMGGGASEFPSTSLTLLRTRMDSEDAGEHFNHLADRYWKPVYCFIRRVWKKSDADAKDLTQQFLIHVLEADVIGRFDRVRGNFRTFLKQCLRNFLSTQARDAARIKRGGGRTFLSIEDSVSPIDVPDVRDPEEEFDRDWAQETINRSIESVETELREAGKTGFIEAFRRYDMRTGPGPTPTYSELAAELGVTENVVRNYLRRVRTMIRDRLLESVGEYVTDSDEALEELQRLLGESK